MPAVATPEFTTLLEWCAGCVRIGDVPRHGRKEMAHAMAAAHWEALPPEMIRTAPADHVRALLTVMYRVKNPMNPWGKGQRGDRGGLWGQRKNLCTDRLLELGAISPRKGRAAAHHLKGRQDHGQTT